jgi:hypothetical protein
VCKTAAILERIIFNACDAVGYHNGREAAAVVERTEANALNTVRYLYASKTAAVSERTEANTRDAVGNGKACICFAYCVPYKCSSVFIIQIAVYGLIILVIFINSNAR